MRSRELDSVIQFELFYDSKQLQKADCELFLIYVDLKKTFLILHFKFFNKRYLLD